MASRRVLVSGLPSGTTETLLVIHFQSARLSGGGDIENVELIGGRQAVITFEEEEAASRVLQRGSHHLQNCQLQVSPVPSTAFTPNQRPELDSAPESGGFPGQSENECSAISYGFTKRRNSEKPPADGEITSAAAAAAIKRQKTTPFNSSENEHDVTEHCTVKVTGLPEGASEELLRNYFENARRSNGGLVSSVIMKPEIQMCLVTFECSDDAKRTVKQARHVLDGSTLEVSLLDSSKGMQPEGEDSADETRLVIRVSGLSPRTTEDSVLNYFENSRRSGGGDISSMEYNKGVAVITFTKVKDVKRLLQRPHHIDNQLLTVVKEPPKRRVPPDPLRVLVQGLNIKTTKDCLCFYLEKFIDVDVADAWFGCHSNALVTFSAEPDFSRLFDGVSKDAKRLEGVKPELSRVPVCSCILVQGLKAETSEDTTQLYFENTRRSGGNVVTRVEKHGVGQALVYFEDPASVETVIRKTHILEGAQLSARPYYPVLEENGTDPQVNRAEIEIDPDVISYIRERHNAELETLLGEHNASVSLDAERSTVTISSLDQRESSVQWKEKAEIIERFLNNFARFKITLTSETFDGVKERWEGADSTQRLANVVVSFDGSSRLAQIIGRREDVKKAENELREIIRMDEENTALKRSIVQLVEDGIPKARLSLLQMSGFCKRLESEYQHLAISVDLEKEKLHLEGPKQVLQDVTVQILKFTSKVVEKFMKLPSGTIQVLRKPSVSAFVEESLKQNGIQAIVCFLQTVNPIEVQIVGVNSESTLRAEKLLKDIVHEESIVLTPENIPVLESPQWKDFKSSLTSAQGRLHPLKVGITLFTDSNTIWVRGIRADVKECIREIRHHLEVNTILYSCVPLDYGSAKFLFEVLKSKVDDIKKGLSTYCVDMRVAPDRNGIEICGTAEGLEKGQPRIQKLIQSVQRDSVPVDKPGMKKFFLQGKGSKLLKSIEGENHCIIVTSESAVDDPVATKSEIMAEDQTGEFICSYTTPEGKKICVFKDDLTKHHVDVIVNAANENLQHIGGLAGDIVRVGGREIQTECDDFVRDNGALLPGHAMVTKPGKLPCKQVIHVVGPKWDARAGSKRKLGEVTREESYLKCAISNALEMAKALRSIAIPAVSSGVYGFPRNLCASVILDAVLEFCKQNPTCNLSEIHLTNYDGPTVGVFVEEIKRRFSQEKSFVDKQRAALTSTGKRHVGEGLYAGSTAHGWTGGLPVTFKTPEGICITVKAGNLAKEEAEILVGTASSDLNLNQNPCARALGQAAGAILQQECTRNGSVAVGNIAVIAQPGKLKCRAVIFAICSSWNGGKGEKVLKSLLKKCLDEAEKMKASSIAFPAIGTGTLQFPRDRVANIYFDTVASYSQTHPSTQLKAVKFVLFDQDIPTVKAFEAKAARRAQNVPFARAKAVGFSSRPSSSSKVYAFSPVKERGSGIVETKVGSLCFQVKNGDITQESTEAIAIVSNPELDVARGGGAGAAVLRSGGNVIQDECSLHGVQTPGSVVVTKAGRLKTGLIFHAIPWPSGDILVTILQCLQEAERRGISSISFPAIGTGNLGMSAKSCAEVMLTAVREFSVQNPTSVQLVRTIIFQSEMLKDFRSAMKDASGEITTDGAGMIWSFVSRFKRFLGFSNTEEAIEVPLSRSEADEREMFLLIFAGCKKDLEGAKTAVKDLMKENCTRQVIEHKAINGLTSQHMQHIHTLELKYHTKVSIERGVDRIVVHGQPEDVMHTVGEIHEIFHSVKENEHKQSQAELLAKNVQWLFKDGSKFEECGLNQNLEMESAYKEKKGTTTIAFGGAKFEVNFKDMTMKDLADGKTTEVKRIDHQEGVQLPRDWDSQPKDQAGKDVAVHLFELSPADNPQQFKDVSDRFKKSCPNTIVKIQRVQNVAVYKTYAIRRKEMEEGKKSNEMLLFHGTPGDNCEQINHKGFNRSFCGKNATMYGNGVYFAKDASYSARPQYSPPDRNGLRYIYLARVLVGEFTTGSQGLLTPPSKNPADPTDTYDTVVDNMSNPGIFVAFYDWQCYPEYLITFQ